MAKYVVSTLSANTSYVGWVNNNGTNEIQKRVLVRGGAGVASTGRAKPVTHEGVLTRITDEEARFLAEHPHFKRHQEKGFVKIINKNLNPDGIAQPMAKDASAPKTPADVEKWNKEQAKKSAQEGESSLRALTNSKK